jgi:hypothetical protein
MFVVMLVAVTAAFAEAVVLPPLNGISSTGMVGAVASQTVRFHIANDRDLFLPSPVIPTDPMRIELSFLDSVGNTVLSSTRTIATGSSAFLDFPIDLTTTLPADVSGGSSFARWRNTPKAQSA